MAIFRIGMKVVCVDGFSNLTREWPDIIVPEKGAIYTIRDIELRGIDPIGLRLNEIHNRKRLHVEDIFDETAFTASAFRPLVERKTDISIFEEMLTHQRSPTPRPLVGA